MRFAWKTGVSGCAEMHRNATCGANAVRAPYAHDPSADVFDHLDKLVDGVALPASELD